MKLRVVKEGRKFFPEKRVMGLWQRFEQYLDPYYRETIYFFDLERAIEFCKSQIEDDQKNGRGLVPWITVYETQSEF